MVISKIRKIELPLRFIEIASNPSSVTSLLLMIWAVWIALSQPFHINIYASLAAFGSEFQWGLLFFLAGLLRFSTYLIRQYWTPPPEKQQFFFKLAIAGSIAVSSCWLVIFVGFLAVDWRLTSTPIYGFLFLSSFIGYLGTTGTIPVRTFSNGH